MSLNRYEQLLFNYLESHPEEERFWRGRVNEQAVSASRRESAVMGLNAMLWEYFEERSRYESPFREIVVSEGLQPVSMLNLSEYLLRVWLPPDFYKKKKKAN